MNFKMIVVLLGIAAVPVCVQAQAPNPPKASKAAKPAKAAPAAPVATVAATVKTISGDKAKIQIYCDIGKLGSQIEDAEQKKDMNKIDELNKRMGEMATKLGPEYVALLTKLEEIDPIHKRLWRLVQRSRHSTSCVRNNARLLRTPA
jgi:hypothetical protein